MKILIQNSLFYPNLSGGAEKSTYLLARELTARGHEIDVLATTGKRDGNRHALTVRTVEGIKGQVFEAPASGMYHDLVPSEATAPSLITRGLHHALNIHSPTWLRLVRNRLAQSRPDVVHTNNLVGMTAVVWLAAKELGIPIAHTIRDLHLLCPRTTLLRSDGSLCSHPRWPCRVLSHLKLRHSQNVGMVTSPTRFMLQKHLAGGAFPDAQTAVVPNACESIPTELPNRQGRNEVSGLYLGTVAKHKGIPELLQALEQLFHDSACDRLHFAFAGKGELTEDVAGFCAIYPDRCRYLGVIQGEAKSATLRESDFVITPSVWPDNFPRVILDGFSHGLPVIGSDRGGIPEVIRHNVDGQIVSPEPKTIADAIAYYTQNDEVRLQHGQMGRERAYDFTLDRQVTRFEEIYQDLQANLKTS